MPMLAKSKPLLTVTLAAALGLAAVTPGLTQGGPGGRTAMLAEMFEKIDVDADGEVTEAELDAHRAAEFTAADTDANGSLDAAELTAHHMARAAEMAADRTARMIEARDSDGDGVLSAAETAEGPAKRHFARLDADSNGALSKAELEAIVAKRDKWQQGQPQDVN